jgi:NADH dehydrogenase [ubiquinone] 1 alpha subcomplex assembly factor 1
MGTPGPSRARRPSIRRARRGEPRRVMHSLVPWFAACLLLAFSTSSLAAQDRPAPSDDETPASLYERMSERRDLRAVMRLIEVAGLAEPLQDLDADPVTVFAPTSEGLGRLGFMFLTGITQRGSEDELADLLRAHITRGALDAAKLAGVKAPLTSLAGGPIQVAVDPDDDSLRIAGCRIVATVSAANGVVHVIDGVIQPTAETLDPERPDVLVDFSRDHAVGGWQQVHDSVMGGRSDGAMVRGGEDYGRFEGKTSLENNGGFASLVTALSAGRLTDATGVSLRVRGDGRTYRFALRERAQASGGTFWCEFATKKGEWIEVSIPFEDFEKNYMGRSLPGRIEGKDVRGLGFYIYDKLAGPFVLDVAWIKAWRKQAE